MTATASPPRVAASAATCRSRARRERRRRCHRRRQRRAGDHGPAEPAKDVVIRADRADGFVLRRVTVRHAAEHGIYVLEADGYLLDRFQALYNEDYGVLTFVEDHGLIRNCEAAGSGTRAISGRFGGHRPTDRGSPAVTPL